MKTAFPVLALAAGLLASEVATAQFRYGNTRRPAKAVGDAAWPAEARAAGIEGEATAVCEVVERSELTDCRVIVERPAGAGFGAALLSLVPYYRARPMGSKPCSTYFHEALIGWSWSKVDKGADWVAKPWSGKFDKFYPPEAAKNQVSGSAVVACTVQVSGRTTGCAAVYESPPGAGFGAAGVAMAATFEFKPAKAGKTPVATTLAIPITFTPSFAPQWNCGAPP